MLFKFSCCYWFLLVNGLVTHVCIDYLNLLAVCNIIDHSGISRVFLGPHEYLGSCLISSISFFFFFFHQGRIPKCGARQMCYCVAWALCSQVPQAYAITVVARIHLFLRSPQTSMEYFGEHWHKEVDYVLFPTLSMSRDLKQTVCHPVCTTMFA